MNVYDWAALKYGPPLLEDPKARQLKMAILKSEILARANKITKEEDSSIDEELLSVIKDLDESVGYLKGTTATGTVGTSGYFTAPSDLIEGLIDSLLLGTDLDPLREITWAEYNEQVIDGYCYHNGRIYVRPTPDSDKSYTLDYRRYHAASLTTLEYPESFRDAVLWGVIQKIYENYERWDDAEQAAKRYEHYKNKLISKYSEPAIVKQRTQYRE